MRGNGVIVVLAAARLCGLEAKSGRLSRVSSKVAWSHASLGIFACNYHKVSR